MPGISSSRYQVNIIILKGKIMMSTDYVMRMVEEFVRVLSRVLFFREMKQYTNAMDELDKLSKMMTGFSLEQFESLGLEGIKDFFSAAGGLNNFSNVEKLFYSAKIVKEEAIIYFEQGKVDEGMVSLALALGMFEMIEGKDIPGLAEEISFIRRNLN